MRSILAVVIALFTMATQAEEFPSSFEGYYRKAVTQCFRSNPEDECRTTYDTIAIKKRDKNSAYVSINIASDNGHGCEYNAIGRLVDGYVVASAVTPTTNRACKVSIHIKQDGSASFQTVPDPGEIIAQCSYEFCSAKGDMQHEDGFEKHERTANQ